MTEQRYGVWLAADFVGFLNSRQNFNWFSISDEYRENPDRAVLGLAFEDSPGIRKAHTRLPPWFSNLLPEGRLRSWIARARGVQPAYELELIAEVGHDLPGAVRVLPVEQSPPDIPPVPLVSAKEPEGAETAWRFSLAGVAMKFSMLHRAGRLTLPSFGEGGDWIVKLPDQRHQFVPQNEYAVMSLGRAVGIDVPEIRLVSRDLLNTIPPAAWESGEVLAFAIRRFDRTESRGVVHIEDLAQVREVFPENKYFGSFETIAALMYRGSDTHSLQEFVRRLTFNVLVSNTDAHLKNWSLIYRDPRRPTISPAYDLVSTAHYMSGTGSVDIGLKLAGQKSFERVRVSHFGRLERRLVARGTDLEDVARNVVDRIENAWQDVQDSLELPDALRVAIGTSIHRRRHSLLARS